MIVYEKIVGRRIRIVFGKDGIKRYYAPTSEDEANEITSNFPDSLSLKHASMEKLSNTAYSSATYGSLFNTEILEIMRNDTEVIEISQKEKRKIISIAFQAYLNQFNRWIV
jgi:hypothetical protein